MIDIYCEHGLTQGMCALCTARAAELFALRYQITDTRDALRELLAEVGPCTIEHGHHCNATGSHRATAETCPACVARELLRSRPPEEAPEPPRQSRGDDHGDE